MATTVSLTEFAGLTLKQKLARAERINRLKAQGLILPLLVFLFVVFLLPIGVLLYKSVENPEVVGSLPRTVEARCVRLNAKAVPEIERLAAVFDEAEGFDAWLSETARGVRELRLSAFGVAQEDFEDICELTFTAGRMDNNPIVFSQAQVMDILRENA